MRKTSRYENAFVFPEKKPAKKVVSLCMWLRIHQFACQSDGERYSVDFIGLIACAMVLFGLVWFGSDWFHSQFFWLIFSLQFSSFWMRKTFVISILVWLTLVTLIQIDGGRFFHSFSFSFSFFCLHGVPICIDDDPKISERLNEFSFPSSSTTAKASSIARCKQSMGWNEIK